VSHFYLDASAVVKRYSPETGSVWVKALTDPTAGHTLVLGEITIAEVAAALAAKHRALGGITQQERDDAVALFLSHCDTQYELIAISRSIIDRAVSLTQSHKLCGYDAVQLATALISNGVLTATGLSHLTFVAADDDLERRPAPRGWRPRIPTFIYFLSNAPVQLIPLLDSQAHQASNEKGAAPTDPATTPQHDRRSRRSGWGRSFSDEAARST